MPISPSQPTKHKNIKGTKEYLSFSSPLPLVFTCWLIHGCSTEATEEDCLQLEASSMKCKLHPYHTGTGVCAACLRERLLSLLSSDKQRRSGKLNLSSSPPSPLSPSTQPAPNLFPRSVSPYVPASSREPKLRFFCTPQAGPATTCSTEKIRPCGGKGKFSFLYAFFGRTSKDKVRPSSYNSWWMHGFAQRGRRKRHMEDVKSTRRCSARAAMSANRNLSWKLTDTGRFQWRRLLFILFYCFFCKFNKTLVKLML